VPGVRKVLESGAQAGDRKPPLWDGHAGPRIAEVVMTYLGENGALG
jgi:UDP-N-acetylglucosamine 2-epimerase (non-hydrolysing)